MISNFLPLIKANNLLNPYPNPTVTSVYNEFLPMYLSIFLIFVILSFLIANNILKVIKANNTI